MRKKIKEQILEQGSLSEFAKKNNIRLATLVDFLNNKRDIRLSTFEKINKSLKIKIDHESITGKTATEKS